jgi:hypothetical protein
VTDTLTPRDPWTVLSAVLATYPVWTAFSAARWHDEAVLAGLNSRQIGEAQDRAVALGWLEPLGRMIDGKWSPNMERATHEEARGRWVRLYTRTDVGQQVDGQIELFQVPA